MRRALALSLLSMALTMSCALVGYNLDGYGRGPASTDGGGGAGGAGTSSGGLAGGGAGVGGAASTSGAPASGSSGGRASASSSSGESSGSGASASSSSGGVGPCTKAPFSTSIASPSPNPATALRVVNIDNALGPDIVAINGAIDWVAVFFNLGAGMFGEENNLFISGGRPTSIAVGYFGDYPRIDVVVTDPLNAGGSIKFFTYDNKGALVGGPSSAVCAEPTSVVVGNFLGKPSDTLSDIAVACPGDKQIKIFDDVKAGTLGTPFTLNAPDVSLLAAADLNKDNRDDLVLSNTSGSTHSVYLLQGALSVPLPLNAGSTGPVAVADFNGDGWPDIATASPKDLGGHIFQATALGVFAPAPTRDLDAGENTYGIVTADFNGDGLQDIAMAGETSLLVYLGKGDGTFNRTALGGSVAGRSIQAADVNGDGWLDIVEGSGLEGKLSVFLNNCGTP